MDQASNSLLGKAVRSRRALNDVGNALLREQGEAGIRTKSNVQAEQKSPLQNNTDSFDVQSAGAGNAALALKPKAQNPNAQNDAWVPLIDPRTLFKAILNAKKLIAFLSVVGLVLGILYAMSMPKYYYSAAEILIDPRDLQISDRELLPTGLPYDASLALVENQTRILTSRRVILGTVEELNLDQDAEFNGKGLGTPGPIETLKAIVFGRASDDPARAKEIAVEKLFEATGVSRAPKTFVISLSVRSEDASKAALIANTMASVYMKVQDEIQSDTVGRANGELGGRLNELRADVEKAERLVEAYRSKNELFDANGKLISDDEISLASTQLTRARERVAELRSRADSARELTLDAVLSDALPEGAASNLIAELRRGYAAKVQQRDALAEKLGAQHPQLRTAEAEVTSAQRGIETELRRLSQTAQIELQRAIKTEQDLAAGQARLKSRQSTISESLVRLRELEREAGARRSVYESLLLRARETGQQAGISTANTTIVSQAVPPLRTYGTSRKLIAIGGMISGFMLGIFLAVLGAIWRSLTISGPENQSGDEPDYGSQSHQSSPPPASPSPNGGNRVQVATNVAAAHDNSNQNPNLKDASGDPMYYPYPVPQYGMLNGNGMMMAPQPQMMQAMHPQMMPAPQMMQPYPYGQQMMPQPMMPQMMMQPMMQQPMMQPMMHQPMMQPAMQQPVIQPVYVAMPQQTPMMQPVAQAAAPAPTAATVAQPQNESDYSEIRGRLQALRDGIVNLADGRQRLSQLG